jgi:hypothetical protein
MNDTKNATHENNKHIRSYTVDALIEKLGLTASVQVWKSIDTIVCVQGVVGKLKPYGRVVYFELIGGTSKIKIKCPLELRPDEGVNVIIEGMAMLQPSRFNTGLDVVIDGKPIGEIEPITGQTDKPIINLEKESFLRLHQLMSESGLDGFCIAGTDTAIRDAVSQINPEFRGGITTEVIRVSDKKTMLSDLKKVVNDSEAFAIVRGGDDASLSLWNDPDVIKELLQYGIPFYVALGHSHFISLTCHYADESFLTPTDLGIAINYISRRLEYQHYQDVAIESLKKEQITFYKDIAVLNEQGEKSSNTIDYLTGDNQRFRKKCNIFKILNLGLILLCVFVATQLL